MEGSGLRTTLLLQPIAHEIWGAAFEQWAGPAVRSWMVWEMGDSALPKSQRLRLCVVVSCAGMPPRPLDITAYPWRRMGWMLSLGLGEYK